MALGFLSRLPLPDRWFATGADSPLAAVRVFPLAGAVLGLLSGLCLLVAAWLRLPALACAFVAVAAAAAMTGALHEDGLGDTADGFFGASTKDRRLEIMKDSRIGTFSAITLIVTIGYKVALITSIFGRFDAVAAVLALIAAESVSRAAMLVLWHMLPSARPGGLAGKIGQPDRQQVGSALLMAFVILALVTWPVGGLVALIYAATLTALSVLGFSRLCLAKIGGQTGDTIGAMQQIAVMAVLTGLVMAM